MGFEFDDSKLLLVSGLATSAYAMHAAFAPKNLNETYMSPGLPINEPITRWFGVALGTCGSVNLVLSTRDHDKKAVKDALKVAGAGWAVSSAVMAYNANEGHQKKELAFPSAAAMAGMAALCLWRGFREDDE